MAVVGEETLNDHIPVKHTSQVYIAPYLCVPAAITLDRVLKSGPDVSL